MNEAYLNAFQLTQVLLALNLVLQSVEMLAIRSSYSNNGLWSWQILRNDYIHSTKPTRASLNFLCSYNNFLSLMVLRLIAAVSLLSALFGFFSYSSNILALLLLIFLHLLISIRWRGNFNGGSDSITLIALTGLLIESIDQFFHWNLHAGLWYISLHSVASYFFSGLVKIKNHEWRNGSALRYFLQHPTYTQDNSMNFLKNILIQNKALLAMTSLSIVLFELTFPLVLILHSTSLFFLSTALVFHLCVFYFFGLNRFVFSWITCYPAIYACSKFHLFNQL
jgi:hypothetical protein